MATFLIYLHFIDLSDPAAAQFLVLVTVIDGHRTPLSMGPGPHAIVKTQVNVFCSVFS